MESLPELGKFDDRQLHALAEHDPVPLGRGEGAASQAWPKALEEIEIVLQEASEASLRQQKPPAWKRLASKIGNLIVGSTGSSPRCVPYVSGIAFVSAAYPAILRATAANDYKNRRI